MKIKKKNIFLIGFFVVGFLLAFGGQRVFAAGTIVNGNLCAVGTSLADSHLSCKSGYCKDGMCAANPNVSSVVVNKNIPATVNPSPGSIKPKTATSCTTGMEAADGTCYKDKSKYCDEVEDTDICGSAAAGTKPKAAALSASSGSTDFTNPLRYKTVEDFLSAIMGAIQKIIVMLALVFIVIGAVMILTSAGSSDMVERGKKSITMALVGFALGVAAPSILKELAGIIGWGQTGAVAKALTLSEIAVRVLNFLLGSMGILALIMMVIGAIMYLTSAGEEGRAEQGKEIFKYAMVGILMAMISMVLVTQIAKFFI